MRRSGLILSSILLSALFMMACGESESKPSAAPTAMPASDPDAAGEKKTDEPGVTPEDTSEPENPADRTEIARGLGRGIAGVSCQGEKTEIYIDARSFSETLRASTPVSFGYRALRSQEAFHLLKDSKPFVAWNSNEEVGIVLRTEDGVELNLTLTKSGSVSKEFRSFILLPQVESKEILSSCEWKTEALYTDQFEE